MRLLGKMGRKGGRRCFRASMRRHAGWKGCRQHPAAAAAGTTPRGHLRHHASPASTPRKGPRSSMMGMMTNRSLPRTRGAMEAPAHEGSVKQEVEVRRVHESAGAWYVHAYVLGSQALKQLSWPAQGKGGRCGGSIKWQAGQHATVVHAKPTHIRCTVCQRSALGSQ